MTVTRRDFLTHVGQLGGYRAVFSLMRVLEMLPGAEAPAAAEMLALARAPRPGIEVVILGAGLAGLAAAWELRQAGYSCTVLEARHRPGGRTWTIRRGTRVEFTDGTVQTCQFGDGLYFNAGAARIPSIHTAILDYCTQFKIPLEVEVNTARATRMQSRALNDGKPVTQRQVINDTRGHVAELLAKAVSRDALDSAITGDDKARMLEFLQKYGDLSPDFLYKGSLRSGAKVPAGAGDQRAVPVDPLDMHALLDANLWDGMLSEEVLDWQATMFQPVGGMDRIPAAFAARLGDRIRYGAEVRQIRQTPDRVRVAYYDRARGTHATVDAHYCICTLPLPVLEGIDTDCANDLKAAVKACTYDWAYKIAWESPRFWERDYHIYGGLSYLKEQPVGVVWYPSANFFAERGVLISGYGIDERELPEFNSLPTTAAKFDASRAAVEMLHPGAGRELVHPLYVSWGRIPYNLGSWISYRHAPLPPIFDRLIAPDGRVYLAGDHTTRLVGWQEGAVRSAFRTINAIGAHARATIPDPA